MRTHPQPPSLLLNGRMYDDRRMISKDIYNNDNYVVWIQLNYHLVTPARMLFRMSDLTLCKLNLVLINTYHTFHELNVECPTLKWYFGYLVPVISKEKKNSFRLFAIVCRKISYHTNVLIFVEFWKTDIPTADTPTYNSTVEL